MSDEKLVMYLNDSAIDLSSIVNAGKIEEMVEDLFGSDVSSNPDVVENICAGIAEVFEKNIREHAQYNPIVPDNEFDNDVGDEDEDE